MEFKFNPISKKINKYKISNGYLHRTLSFIIKIYLLSINTSTYELFCITIKNGNDLFCYFLIYTYIYFNVRWNIHFITIQINFLYLNNYQSFNI